MPTIEIFTLAALLLEKRVHRNGRARSYRATGTEIVSLLAGFVVVTLLVTALQLAAGDDRNRVMAMQPTASAPVS